MRLLRRSSGESLRQLEAESTWGRGTLSEVENGKALPSQQLVDFYEARYAGDGLLRSLYAEAHVIHLPVGPPCEGPIERILAGDAMEISTTHLPSGMPVRAEAEFLVGWMVRNIGSVPWDGRSLARVGASAGAHILGGPPLWPMPAARPGESVDVAFPVSAPQSRGTVVAHWRMVHADGGFCFTVDDVLGITVVVT
jgi:hypothetical protein